MTTKTFSFDNPECYYENHHYRVALIKQLEQRTHSVEIVMHDTTYYEGYAVISKGTGVVEYMTTSLPEAIFNAEQFDVALTNETWKWMREENAHPAPIPSVLN